ncbi:MAG: cobalamin-dependent protein [Lachnospiraceae bacterium]|nr:cobalamin-dependent protein [Lachnospiraceae bacterium]MBR5917586.1 cobalamin-dependent protein [Lachnospiraceae bacterium]
MICEPLELEYISANIEALGHTCNIVDMIIEKKNVPYFVKLYNPDVVGITGYISHVNIMKRYAKEAKEVNENIVTIIGGVHAEVNPGDFESPYVDYIIRANGIRTFIDILNKLEKDKEKNNGELKNDGKETSEIIGEEDEIECIYVPGKKPPKKDTTFNYLYPDREKVNKYRSKYYYMFHRNCTLIKTSFGCPYNCKFCFCRQIMDDQYFARDLEDIVAELETIPETEIYIVDDDFLVGRERILKFCDLLEQKGIEKKYLIYGRADYVAANEDVIKRFKEVGLRAVIVGLESCDSKQLDDYNKRTNVEINEKAVGILKKYDVECYGTFILGLDWTKEDFNALHKWIKKLGLVFVNLQPLTPLRGTDIYEKYKPRFIVREDEYEKWDLAHLVVRPDNISVRKYYWYTMVLYYKITANPVSGWYMVKKYGLHDTLKLSFGAVAVNNQYWKKLIEGEKCKKN